MLDIKTLLPELKKLVTDLSEDLLARSTETSEINAGLREAYTQIEKGGRTADAFEVWREDYLDQVAVAWVLGCVFVRFMEDNHLIDECWLAGDGERRKLAEDTHELYFREHPHESDREYFEHVFHEVGKIPACRDLFAEGKTPLWAVGPSGDAAMKLLAFWREIDADTGHLARSFEVEDGDTRFLGDLYQDLSERARKKYALLQTPVFVEEFILDRTLDPAIDEFGLDEVRMIDPTCGSGHFLLGGFARLFDLWIKREDNEVVAAQKALDGVWGVDINPFAVAVARFRLIVAALRACGIERLKEAPAWNIHLATGDSLLFGSRWDREGKKKSEQQFLGTDEESWAPEIYACEDKEAISEVLGQQYHAVVGNPPYITVKDKSLNQAYRLRYSTCHRQYSLGVPFTERFFRLALPVMTSAAGYVGMITANSFMKREFGKKLIEEFLPTLDLTHVIDTSPAHPAIESHGTATVILFGRNKEPVGTTIRSILGIRSDKRDRGNPTGGRGWKAIVESVDNIGLTNEFLSVVDTPREVYSKHPWSMGGGGAANLREKLEAECDRTLNSLGSEIGFLVITGEDNCLVLDNGVAERHGLTHKMPMVLGDEVRDWVASSGLECLWPCDERGNRLDESELDQHLRFCWSYRTTLKGRKAFGVPVEEKGIPWWALRELYSNRLRTPYSIVFAFVATHNHFVLSRGGQAFNRSAPIIKLGDDASEDDYLALTGLLNSSAACFWMKQVCYSKGAGGINEGVKSEQWEQFREFAGMILAKLPVPKEMPTVIARSLDGLARRYQALVPSACLEEGTASIGRLRDYKNEFVKVRQQMISLQEELDWECYRLYGLFDEDVSYGSDNLPHLELGQRAFEIVMARKVAEGELETSWFERHGSTPITEIPTHWPDAYQNVVQRRIDLIESNREIALVEQPDQKRRWNTESWDNQRQRALKYWLLDRLEGTHFWPNPEQHEPRLQSVAELSDKTSGDHDFLQVAAIYRGREDFDVAALVAELVESESVPFLPILRYKPAGLRKREVWEKTWELQRKEDAGEDVGEIKVPPKYASADFQSSDYWRLRGKLDVPKERWISFPLCETESDPSLVVGWAGWNYLQQATALIAYYDARKREGWDAKRLTPLLAGLDQILPWIHQWHLEVDPEFGETAGQSFQTMLEADAHELGLTLDDIRAWEPPKKTKTRRKRKTK